MRKNSLRIAPARFLAPFSSPGSRNAAHPGKVRRGLLPPGPGRLEDTGTRRIFPENRAGGVAGSLFRGNGRVACRGAVEGKCGRECNNSLRYSLLQRIRSRFGGGSRGPAKNPKTVAHRAAAHGTPRPVISSPNVGEVRPKAGEGRVVSGDSIRAESALMYVARGVTANARAAAGR
jgi:hypothetical protein